MLWAKMLTTWLSNRSITTNRICCNSLRTGLLRGKAVVWPHHSWVRSTDAIGQWPQRWRLSGEELAYQPKFCPWKGLLTKAALSWHVWNYWFLMKSHHPACSEWLTQTIQTVGFIMNTRILSACPQFWYMPGTRLPPCPAPNKNFRYCVSPSLSYSEGR